MKPLKFAIYILIFVLAFSIYNSTFNIPEGIAQQVEVVGITDSATVTSKWLGDKTARFLVSGLTNMYLQRQSDSHKDWASEIGSTGFYEFDSVYLYPGIYELYINGILKQEYGAVLYQTTEVLNDTNYVHTSGANEYIWVTNLYSQGQVQFYNYCPASLVGPTISSHLVRLQYLDDLGLNKSDTNYVTTTGTEYIWGPVHATGQWIFYNVAPASLVAPTIPSHLTTKQYVDDLHNNDTNLIKSTGSEAIYGVCSFFGITDFSSQVTFYNNAPETSVSPTLPGHLTNKYYVDYAVGLITVTPYQEASNHVRVISNGTEENGKVYTAFSTAIAYFSTASGVNPCWVQLVGVGTTIALSHNDLVNYVHVYSDNPSMGIVLGLTGASATKTMTFKETTIYMGNQGGITTARTYNSFSFINCTIYAYNDVTFTNCNLTGTTMYNESGEGVTYDGSTRIINSNFNQLTTEGGSFTGIISGMLDGIDPTYSMPSDPTAP